MSKRAIVTNISIIAIILAFICGLCTLHNGLLALMISVYLFAVYVLPYVGFLGLMIAVCLVPFIPVLIAGIWTWRARKTFGPNHIFVLAGSLVWCCCGLVFLWQLGEPGYIRHDPPTKLEQLKDFLERFIDPGTPVHPNSKL